LYEKDSEEILDKCFEYDWGYSKVHKLVKNEEELPVVKRVFKQNYSKLKEIYKLFAA
jgi:hypothetical protein